MLIRPSEDDYLKWTKCIPTDGDLLFLSKETSSLLNTSAYRLQRKEDAKSYWTFNARSWYGYSLRKADYFVWLPTGTLETFDETLLDLLAAEQVRMGVPTVIETPSLIHSKILKFSKGSWLSSKSFTNLESAEEQALFMRLWSAQNEVPDLKSIPFEHLPQSVQSELNRVGYKDLLNSFCEHSGPNCFAAVAGALEGSPNFSLINQWMQWSDLHDLLENFEYQLSDSQAPLAGDVLVFSKDESPLHASYSLGEGLYFEKASQNFYSPYRVDFFESWQSDWPETSLSIWRKKV